MGVGSSKSNWDEKRKERTESKTMSNTKTRPLKCSDRMTVDQSKISAIQMDASFVEHSFTTGDEFRERLKMFSSKTGPKIGNELDGKPSSEFPKMCTELLEVETLMAVDAASVFDRSTRTNVQTLQSKSAHKVTPPKHALDRNKQSQLENVRKLLLNAKVETKSKTAALKLIQTIKSEPRNPTNAELIQIMKAAASVTKLTTDAAEKAVKCMKQLNENDRAILVKQIGERVKRGHIHVNVVQALVKHRINKKHNHTNLA